MQFNNIIWFIEINDVLVRIQQGSTSKCGQMFWRVSKTTQVVFRNGVYASKFGQLYRKVQKSNATKKFSYDCVLYC